MAYGFQYNAAGSRCSGKCQPGTLILSQTMMQLAPELGTLGCYNCRTTRTGSSLSLHGVGRAWDCKCAGALNIKAGQFFVDAAEMLGVQRVICGFGPGKAPKEWDSREGQRYWSDYSGPTHDDHCHVELCIDASLHLTVQQVKDAFVRHWPGATQEALMVNADDEKKIRAIVKDELGKAEGLLISVVLDGKPTKVGLDWFIKALGQKAGIVDADGNWVG